MTDAKTCPCENCSCASCDCNGSNGPRAGGCCCGPTCKCGAACACPPSCGCPATKEKKA